MKTKLLRICISVLICMFIGFLGNITTQSSIQTWYLALEKPIFTPPNWLFGPVWSVLFVMMGIAAGIVWSKDFHHKWVKTALYLFGFQLMLNVAWSIFFFGMRNPLLALLDIIALFILLLFTIRSFKTVNATASYLLIPYLIWVAFATALNFCIWQLN